jgi:hypothetical protein
MALRGSRIKNFDDLWCLRALEGLEFCVSSTSFQKSNIGLASTASNRKVAKIQPDIS